MKVGKEKTREEENRGERETGRNQRKSGSGKSQNDRDFPSKSSAKSGKPRLDFLIDFFMFFSSPVFLLIFVALNGKRGQALAKGKNKGEQGTRALLNT